MIIIHPGLSLGGLLFFITSIYYFILLLLLVLRRFFRQYCTHLFLLLSFGHGVTVSSSCHVVFIQTMNLQPPKSIIDAYVLLNLGDSVTTDHISPAGNIARNSSAARYLTNRG